MVVKIMLELWKGSKPAFFMNKGIDAPDRPAKIKLNSIPKPITKPRYGFRYHTQATNAVTTPIKVPFMAASFTLLHNQTRNFAPF